METVLPVILADLELYLVQAVLKLVTIFLPRAPKRWDCKPAPHSARVMFFFSHTATPPLSEETKPRDETSSLPFAWPFSSLPTPYLPHGGLIFYPPLQSVKWVKYSPCRSEVTRGMGSWGKAAWAWGSDSHNSSSKGMGWGARGILCGAAQAPGGTPSPICWLWKGRQKSGGRD